MNEVIYVCKTPHQEKNLSLIQQTYLTDESQLFRVQLRRYIQAETVALDQMDYGTGLQALPTFSLAAECFNRLVRIQAILDPSPSDPKTCRKELRR